MPNSDYAMLVKQYDRRGIYTGAEKTIVTGDPDIQLVSTSMVERYNLTLRMTQRRFTRKTNGYSKKFENHGLCVALQTFHYNFVRSHATLGTTPAVAARVESEPWTLERFLDEINAAAPKPNRPRHYRKRGRLALTT